jgi:hypothetical protein
MKLRLFCCKIGDVVEDPAFVAWKGIYFGDKELKEFEIVT